MNGKRVLSTWLGSALLAAAVGCGPSVPEGPLDGPKLFRLSGCYVCHKLDGSGSPQGPALRDLERFWTRETLVEYLRDPKGVAAADPRLKAQMLDYRIAMPPTRISDEYMAVLVEYVFSF